ncbi:cupin domain-containing protein [Marinomonas communis]|uniref:ChrR-like anti-ECFsigma factor n=1 Tax=Marinomonas communis TaxID=28254 RepID=A0A4R6X679_9GAMM|nr:cupin domain-containing protein [Marinomonas communis]TDR13389.1 ChrR-like anti-ECFsigma factor [Marinomonas communis]
MLNMNFSVPVLLNAGQLDWVPSPMPGVDRKPLAREDMERGHATSIVRYAPGSIFRPHPHPLGEEILVLSGEFCDEAGCFPQGTYFRNPPGSSHAPFSPKGCILFVKLHQFQPLDTQQVVSKAQAFHELPLRHYVALHEYETERVGFIRLDVGDERAFKSSLPIDDGAVELLVVSGSVRYGEHSYPSLSWLRLPVLDWHTFSISEQSILWVKQGHF